MRRVILLWAVLVALSGAVSAFVKGGDDGAVEAGPALLAQAADRSAASAFRYELYMSIDSAELSFDDVLLGYGELAGGRDHTIVDMGELFAQIPDAPPDVTGADLTTEMITDGTALYMRSPMFAFLAELDPSVAEVFGGLATLRDQWGYVDITALGEFLPEEVVAAATGNNTADPTALIDVVRKAGDVESLGRETVKEVAAQGFRARVPMADLLRASGTDPQAFAELVGEDSAELLDIRFPMEVWVDDAGFIRRIGMSYDEEFIEAVGPEAEDAGIAGMSMRMDLFGYGDPSIAVQPPGDAIDVTQDFLRLLELG